MTKKDTSAQTPDSPAKAPHPFRAVRRAAVPLVAFETADPNQTMLACMASMNGAPVPYLVWDCIVGLRAIRGGKDSVVMRAEQIANDVSGGDADMTLNLTQCLSLVAKNYKPLSDEERGAVFFLHSGHKATEDWTATQAIWNLRDQFKRIGATLVLLAPALIVPPELKHDLIVISEDLPGEAELERIAKQVAKNVDEGTDWPKVVDTLRGLSAFAAEQVVAMSMVKTEKGYAMDTKGLWERKRKMVEQTPGLKVWRGGENFSNIGGCDAIKAYLRDYLNGPARMRAVVWIDEIEKSMAGASGDTSGVSQDQLGALLTYMQDSGARGVIFVGPPGAAKSAIAKATGNEANVPTIALDLGGMKSQYVGASEMQLRNALKVIDAISDGKAIWLATCNSLAILPPELKRRFALGTWFFDLPSLEERKAIWEIYKAQYDGVTVDIGPENLPGWTGAEIRALFDTAWSTGRPLSRASRIIVPVCKSAADKIKALQQSAVGKFSSASKEGWYEIPSTSEAVADAPRRMED